MKKLLFIIMTFGLMSANGQYFNLIFDFENESLLNHVIIDTINNPNNIWQIGNPQKTIFNQSYSLPYGIMTDTIDYYPSHDTSSFIIKFAWTEFLTAASLSGYYRFDSDTLLDFGTIELSLDKGVTWSNILEDSIIPDWAWYPEKPIFTGKIENWKYFSVLTSEFYPINLGDSIYYRFTFFSDGIQSNKEGWLLDDIQVIVLTEGEEDITKKDPVFLVYPNPTNRFFTLDFRNTNNIFDFKVYNCSGKKLMEKNRISKSKTTIDIGKLQTGLYFYEIDFDNQKNVFGKIIKK